MRAAMRASAPGAALAEPGPGVKAQLEALGEEHVGYGARRWGAHALSVIGESAAGGGGGRVRGQAGVAGRARLCHVQSSTPTARAHTNARERHTHGPPPPPPAAAGARPCSKGGSRWDSVAAFYQSFFGVRSLAESAQRVADVVLGQVWRRGRGGSG